MKRVDLTKYGFIRTPEYDFSDDGTRFTCYKIGRVRVSKTTYNGEVFIAGAIEDGILFYSEYSKLPHYNAMDALNGFILEYLTEDDIKKFFNDCKEYDKEYSEYESTIVESTVDEVVNLATKIRDARKAELDYINDHLPIEALLSLDEYKFKNVKSFYKSIKLRYESAKQTINEPDSVPNRRLYCDANKDNINQSWFFTEIVEICKI